MGPPPSGRVAPLPNHFAANWKVYCDRERDSLSQLVNHNLTQHALRRSASSSSTLGGRPDSPAGSVSTASRYRHGLITSASSISFGPAMGVQQPRVSDARGGSKKFIMAPSEAYAPSSYSSSSIGGASESASEFARGISGMAEIEAGRRALRRDPITSRPFSINFLLTPGASADAEGADRVPERIEKLWMGSFDGRQPRNGMGRPLRPSLRWAQQAQNEEGTRWVAGTWRERDAFTPVHNVL